MWYAGREQKYMWIFGGKTLKIKDHLGNSGGNIKMSIKRAG
jgi:hypothetical protein